MKKLRITNPRKFALGVTSLLMALMLAVVGVHLIKDSIELTDVIKLNDQLTHNVSFDHYDKTGKLLAHYEYKNIVVNAGKAGVASRINGADSEAAFTYIGIGTGTTSAAATDTALESEIASGGGSRASATCSRVTVTVTNDTAQLVLTYNFTSSFAVTESAVLNAASSGTMLARRVFSAINVSNGDSLQVTWKFTAS